MRAKTLLPKNAISRADYDLALSNADEAAATVDLMAADLAKAQWQLDNCIIRAPISGTILKKNAEEGSLVNPAAMQGFYSLCEMADLSDLEVDLDDPGARHQQDFQGPEVQGAGRGVSRPRV